jgi:hypothetical protein
MNIKGRRGLNPRTTIRFTDEDMEIIAAVRAHLRTTGKLPWATRADVIRTAIRTAAEALKAAGEAVGMR